jgi:flagellar hook-length control protein FliK
LDEGRAEDTPVKDKASPKSKATENAPQFARETARPYAGAEKTEARAEAVFNQLLPQAENSAAGTETAKLSLQHRQEIFEQVENGLVRSLHDGGKQIILRLDPPELGKMILSLTVAQGEVRAVIRAESPAAAQAVSEQLAQLKASLEEQGFKVSSLEVETRTPSHAGTEHWDGAEQHNQRQELREQAGFLRLAQFRGREAETLVRTVQSEEQAASYSASGLHIIA